MSDDVVLTVAGVLLLIVVLAFTPALVAGLLWAVS